MLRPLKIVSGTLLVVIIGIILLDTFNATQTMREMFAFLIAGFLSVVVLTDYLHEKRS